MLYPVVGVFIYPIGAAIIERSTDAVEAATGEQASAPSEVMLQQHQQKQQQQQQLYHNSQFLFTVLIVDRLPPPSIPNSRRFTDDFLNAIEFSICVCDQKSSLFNPI